MSWKRLKSCTCCLSATLSLIQGAYSYLCNLAHSNSNPRVIWRIICQTVQPLSTRSTFLHANWTVQCGSLVLVVKCSVNELVRLSLTNWKLFVCNAWLLFLMVKGRPLWVWSRYTDNRIGNRSVGPKGVLYGRRGKNYLPTITLKCINKESR